MYKYILPYLTIQIIPSPETPETPFVSYTPELDISSCGATKLESERNLYEAIELFLKTTQEMGTLDKILTEAGIPNLINDLTVGSNSDNTYSKSKGLSQESLAYITYDADTKKNIVDYSACQS